MAELPESVGQLVVPRGRYGIEFYPTFMRFVGRTYEFKVAYRSVARMFYLEKPYAVGDAPTRFSFVIGLTDPVRQGNQRHPYLVLSLDSLPGDGEFSVPLSLTAEDVAEGRYSGLGAGGRTTLSGDLPKTVAMLFKHITGKAVYKAGLFRSRAGQRCVRCAVKSNDGLLYPLDKSLVFLHKPTLWVPYADVERAEIKRGGGADGGGVAAGRTFDLVLHVRATAAEAAREITFQSIDAAERSTLRDWLASEGRGVRVTEQEARSAAAIARALAEEDGDDEDEDDEEGAGSKRRRASSKQAGGGGDDDDDEDEEDDEVRGCLHGCRESTARPAPPLLRRRTLTARARRRRRRTAATTRRVRPSGGSA